MSEDTIYRLRIGKETYRFHYYTLNQSMIQTISKILFFFNSIKKSSHPICFWRVYRDYRLGKI